VKIDSGGVALDVQVEGEGRPVVLVHGWPDTKRLWSKQVPALVDAGFQVITYDQRGYGASDKPAEVEAYAIPFLAIDATNILDHLGIERAHFVGHDWGAAVVWAVASFAPERVDHLVALSVGHPSAFSRMDYAQREKSWYMLLFQFPEAEDLLRKDDWALLREWMASHPELDAAIERLAEPGALTAALNWYRRLERPDLGPALVPVTYVWGEDDYAMGPVAAAACKDFVAPGLDYRFVPVPGISHWIVDEAPGLVADEILTRITA
jgi:pimeloyl-ACP methyl ester carboxylesterase